MNLRQQKTRFSDAAFTLIELLTVIAIIGIITAMIVNLAPAVNQRKKRDRVNVERVNLTTMIESYKAKFGHYPPDNANLAMMTQPMDTNSYDVWTQVNPLFYELGGGSNNFNGSSSFLAFDGLNSFPQKEMAGAFGIQGILNADQEMQVVYQAPTNAHSGYPAWMVNGSGNTAVQGLTVPVDTVQWSSLNKLPTKYSPTQLNFWHYDASSIFRHNQSSYDLWAVYSIKRLPMPANSPPNTPPLWQYATNNNWGQ